MLKSNFSSRMGDKNTASRLITDYGRIVVYSEGLEVITLETVETALTGFQNVNRFVTQMQKFRLITLKRKTQPKSKCKRSTF